MKTGGSRSAIDNVADYPSDLPDVWPNGRRLSDKIMQVFRYACLMRNYEGARLLLDVYEQVEARHIARFGGDRRRVERVAQSARRWLNRQQLGTRERW